MTALTRYDAARTALAQAVRVDEILPLLDEFELAKLRAKQIQDQALLADATEFQLRAERRLGEVITAAKAAGLFKQGRQPKVDEKSTDPELSSRPTLAEAGIDKKLSAKAQQRSGLAEQAFEAMVDRTRERISAGHAKIVSAPSATMHSRNPTDNNLDYFPTPPWATRALIEIVLHRLSIRGLRSVWEPACGEGHIAEALAEYFPQVFASDIHPYGYADILCDFLARDVETPPVDWIITNPPFSERGNDRTADFVLRARELAGQGVAMFVRSQWISEGIGRYERIFRDHAPTLIAFFAERVPLHEGRWEPDGDTLTAYCWLVWLKHADPRSPMWIPPGQREALERAGDRERFVTKPVTKAAHVVCDAPFDPDTGEILDEPQPLADAPRPAMDEPAAEEPVVSLRPPPADPWGDPDLDIPAFLKRAS